MRSQKKIKYGKQIVAGCLNILALILLCPVGCQASDVIRYRDLNREKHVRIYVDQSGSIRSQEKIVKDIVEVLYNMFYLEEEIDCEIYGFSETVELIGVNQLKTENVKEELFRFDGQETILKEVITSIDEWEQEGECYAIIVSDMYDSESQSETTLKPMDEYNVETYVVEWDNPEEAKNSGKICIEGAERIYVPNLYNIKAYETIKKDVLRVAAQIYYDTEIKWETGEEIYRRQDETDEFFFSSTDEIENDILEGLVKLEENLSGGGYLYYFRNVPAAKVLDEADISFKNCNFLILPQVRANIREEEIYQEIYEDSFFTVKADIVYGENNLDEVSYFRVKFQEAGGDVYYQALEYNSKEDCYQAEVKLKRGEYILEINRFAKTVPIQMESRDVFPIIVKAPQLVFLSKSHITDLLNYKENSTYDIEIYLPDYLGQKTIDIEGVDPLWQVDELQYEVEFNFKAFDEICEIKDGTTACIHYKDETQRAVTIRVTYKEENQFTHGIECVGDFPLKD